MSAQGCITAPQPEAAEAGADVLRDGGNAVDAAVACALVQSVVDPFMCGLAGFGSAQVLMADGRHGFIDFHGRAPAAARPDMWADIVLGEAEDGFGFLLEGAVNEIGYQSVTTPMTLRALALALERYGTRSLADLLPAAIHYAEEGFAIRPAVTGYWHEVPKAGRVAHIEFLTRIPATAKCYLRPDGTVPRIGDIHRNADMARTLRRIAEAGPEDFYTGAIAGEIAADMAAHGGLLSAEDLAEARPTEGAPLWGDYRGYRIATNQPPGGGVILLEMLNILEQFDLAGMGHNSAEYVATVSEAMKIATVDKDTKVGDPRFVEVPVAELTSKDYAAAAAARIRAGEKAHVPRLNRGPEEPKDTTHICTVDCAGNLVTMTHSIGMPSGVVTEGLGFMYNGCMGVFDPRPGRAGSLAPGKSRFTAMCPTILFDGEGPAMAIGAPGGTYITMGVLQGILNMVDFGMTAAEAVAAPRFCTTSDTIDLTNRVLRRTEAGLQAMGYATRRSAMSYGFAAVHALRRGPDGWRGGADPGRDGMAVLV
ncbi:MAG: gamma-glutamyltransferase family protein [Pseudomonadota bacterium]